VAITRTKLRLWLTFANARYRFGQLQQNDPSRFIDEIPEQHVDKSYAGGGVRNLGGGSAFERMNRGFGNNNGNNNWNKPAQQAERQYGAPPAKKPAQPSYLAPKPQNKVVEHTPSTNFVASDTSNLQAGQQVEHQKFGFGEVQKVEGSAHNPVATVLFKLNGEKKIMLNYAKLMIVA
jgi:DNA helicase II / ATP-dependent DNA helicase PcrA